MDNDCLGATTMRAAITDSLATENMPAGDSVWGPLRVVRLVANVATRIRMDHKHLNARVEGPRTGGDVRSQVRTRRTG